MRRGPEGLGSRPSDYTRQITESNPGGGWAAWYLFCKRTGHGDAEAAAALAEAALAKQGPGAAVAAPQSIGYFYWLRGDLKKAGASFRKAYDAGPSAHDVHRPHADRRRAGRRGGPR